MQSNDLLANLYELDTQRKETANLLRKEKEKEILLINMKYNDVLEDYAVNKAKLYRMIYGVIELCESEPEETRSKECKEKILKAYDAAMEKTDRTIEKFHQKWGSKYEDYEEEIKAVNKKYKKLKKLARNPAVF